MGPRSHLQVPRLITLLGTFLVISFVAAQGEATLTVFVTFQGMPVPATDLEVVLASTAGLRFFGPISENPAVFTVEPGTYIILASAGVAQGISPNIALAAGESQQVTVELLPSPPPLMPAGEQPPPMPAGEQPVVAELLPIAIGEIVIGSIPASGMPVLFTFSGTAGTTIRAEVFASREGSALDSTLILSDNDDNELASNDDSNGLDSLIEYQLPADGTYTLRLEDPSGNGGADYFYRLELSQIVTFTSLPVPEGDINLAALDGVQLNASSVYDDFYSPERVVDGDLDTSFFTAVGDAANLGTTPFLEVVLPVDATVDLVQVRGNRAFTEGFDVTQGRLELFDATGTLLFSTDFDLLPPDQDADVATGGVSGVRRVRFTFLADESDEPGFSELFIWGRPVQERLIPSDTIAIGQTVEGIIARPGDQNQFTFTAAAGMLISAQVLAHRLGSPLNPTLQLLAPDGSGLLFNDDFPGLSSDSRLDAKLPQDGQYTLVVGSSDGSGGPEYTYQLALEPGAAVTVTVFEAPGVPVTEDDPGLQTSLLDAAGNQVVSMFGRNPVTLLAPPGDYQLQTRLDFAERLVPLTLAAGQELTATVEFDFGRLIVQVIETEGIPAQDALTTFSSDTYFTTASGSQQEGRLPAGNYTINAFMDNFTSTRENVLVEPGTLQELTIDLQLQRLEVALPAAQGIVLASGDTRLELQLLQDTQTQVSRITDTSATQPISMVARAGPATVRFTSGLLTLDVPVTVVAGQTLAVPFDAPALAAQYDLSLFTVTIHDQAGQVATQGTQVALIDPESQTLLALAQDPPPGTTWLAPGGVLLRSRLGDQEQLRHLDVPVGVPAEVVIDFAAVAQAGMSPTRVQVDIVIESPQDGAVVRGEQVTVTGRASTTGPAGATRIAMVLDVSGSADRPSGADLDGDGVEESVLQAEVAAGKLLLDELERIEAQGPGTAFAVAVLRYSSEAEVMAPLVHMTDLEGVAALRAGLDRIAQEGTLGGNNEPAALDAAVTALRAREQPDNTFILFMTDGDPDLLKPSLDAALRTGLAGVVIHTFGLGSNFLGEISPSASFPPDPSLGPGFLATMAALGAPGGTLTALPHPTDILQFIPSLPVLELPEVELQTVQVTNVTTGQPALSIELSPDGAFQAQVPVSLVPLGTLETNILAATAFATDGVSSATAQVQVRGLVLPALTATLSTIDQNRGTLEAGDVLTFVLTLTNSGPGAATGLDITIPLPEGIVVRPGTLRASQLATLTEEAGQLRVQLNTLPPPGAGWSSLVITFQGIFQSDAALQATVTSQELGTQASDDPFTIAEDDATGVQAAP